MTNDVKIFRFKEESLEPIVEYSDGNLTYLVPVSCGFIEKNFKFSISEKELDILKCDEERRYFLYAILHSLYQPRPVSTALQTDPLIGQVLFGTISEVEKLLSLHDAKSNGSVSNLIRIYMGYNQCLMRSGRWFSERET